MANPHTDEQETLWTDRRHILWFPWTFDVYRVANGRIYCRKGLFNQEENECMIYRVLDVSLKRTLLNRICGTGSVILRTKDASDSILTLKNIRNSQQVKDMLNNLKVTDRICTIGGIYGTITGIHDDTITLAVGKDNLQMVVARWAIRSVEEISIENDAEALN